MNKFSTQELMKDEANRLHSSAGLGSYLTVILALLFIYIGEPYFVVASPIIIALGKELFDLLRYGKPQIKGVLSTLNPMIVIKWYVKVTN